ncbi:hypothetical protein [Saccharopolyspora erythraea]|uniref:hypothetical protein n=1 Tax=Saccharopolyspora erythraea TaxID=1836 RepID=UPI0012FFB2BB|nr:hypothetical protein [Saccharopolyspora erythraea]
MIGIPAFVLAQAGQNVTIESFGGSGAYGDVFGAPATVRARCRRDVAPGAQRRRHRGDQRNLVLLPSVHSGTDWLAGRPAVALDRHPCVPAMTAADCPSLALEVVLT